MCGGEDLAPQAPETRLLRGEQLVMTGEAVEVGRGAVTEGEHRLDGIAILPLQTGERVEPVVDRLQAAGLEDDLRAQLADREERFLDLCPGRRQRLGRRREGRVETTEILKDLRRSGEPAEGRGLIVPQSVRRLREPRAEALGVLQSSPLAPELLFLPGA